MKPSPTVTVLMSVYNDAAYVGKAIESVLSQSYQDYEFIIIDDGSTDGTGEVIRGFDDPRIRIFEHENRGLVPSLNRGLELARGTYLARLDGDDVSRPDRLALQLEYMSQNPECPVVGSWATVHDLSGAQVDKIEPPSADLELRWKLIWGIVFPHSTLFLRTGMLRDVGGWDEPFWREYPHASDYDLIERLGHRGPLAAIPEYLLKWQYDTETGISIVHKEAQKRTGKEITGRQIRNLLGDAFDTDAAEAAWLMVNSPKHLQAGTAMAATRVILDTVDAFARAHPGSWSQELTDEWLANVASQLLDRAGRSRAQQLDAIRAARELSPGTIFSGSAAKAAFRSLIGVRRADRLVGRN